MVNKELLQKLMDEGYVKRQSHQTLPLFIYKYTKAAQYEQKWSEYPSLKKLRGYITDHEGSFVAKGFSKFFNMEEPESQEIVEITTQNITDTIIKKKYDGSLIIIFYYGGKWHTATNGSFHSDQSIEANKILHSQFDVTKFNTNYTYLAEYIGPSNRIVVNYEKDTLMFIGANYKGRRISFQKELFVLKNAGIPQENIFEYFRFDGNRLSFLKNKNIENEEGYVASNEFGCFKIKFDDYIRLHKMMTQLRTVDVWESVSNSEPISKILENVPDEYFNRIKKYERELCLGYITLSNQLLETFKVLKENSNDRKSFALLVQKEPKEYRGIYFKLYQNQDISESIWKLLKPKSELL